MTAIGKIFVGLVVAAFGALILLVDRLAPGRGWLLPGDIYIRRDNFVFYFPIVTSIVVSVVLSLILYLLARR